MPKKLELTGQKFGRLTVISFSHMNNWGTSCWLCKCGCGNIKIIVGRSLKAGLTRSCGCLHNEGNRMKHGYAKQGKRHYLYYMWKSMHQRCNNPNSKAYKWYGGRGIKICSRWNNFENFLEDMGDCPEGTSIDRINNDGDYCKKNCRWATPKEQTNNSRKPDRKGEKGNTARLTEEQVLYIREECKKGKKQIELAREFGVTRPAITAIVHRRTWKHI